MDTENHSYSSTKIPSVKLLALLEASEKMMEAVSHRDRESALSAVVIKGHDLLNAESCAIFLAEQDLEYSRPNKLVLEAYHTDKETVSRSNKVFPIVSAVHGGISAHVAKQGKLLRMNATEIDRNPHIKNIKSTYLPSGKCFSSIIVPLKDKKDILLGILKVDNKKGVGGQPGKGVEFTAIDEEVIRILAKNAIVLLENLRVSEVINSFMKDMQDARSRDSVSELIITWARNLLRADRSELALWDERKEKLIFKVISGNKDARTAWTGMPVPEDGFIMKVWEDQGDTYSISNDVSKVSNYYPLDHRTKSEIALRIEIDNSKIGILNIESFQNGWFDDKDLRILKILAQHAALSIQLIRVEEKFHHLAHEVMENTASDSQEMLEKILFGIREIYGFDGALFYIYENKDDEEKLRCLAYIGSEDSELDYRSFAHDLKSPSLAAYVFNSREAKLSEKPHSDPNVSEHGLKQFNIKGSLLGIPLKFRESVIGVLTIWGINDSSPSRSDIKLLEPFARLAASKIALRQAEQKLKESEALYRSLIDNLPQSVFRKDRQSRFVSANKTFYESLKLQSEVQIKGTTDYDYYPEDIANKYVADDVKVMNDDEPEPILGQEEKHQTKWMSEPIWVRTFKTPVYNAAGDIIGLQAIFWDFTKERQMRDRYRSLVNHSPNAMILHQDGKSILVNGAALKLFGVSSEIELASHSIIDFVHPDDRNLAESRLKKLTTRGKVDSKVEMRIQRKNGEIAEVEVYSFNPLPEANEIQVVINDVTHVNKLLKETSRLLFEMHHRVRRSLNQIDGLLSQQESHTIIPPEAQSVYKEIRNRIQAMALVHKILFQTREETIVDMDIYLSELRDAVLKAHGIVDAELCTIDVVGIGLDEVRAQYCGLIVNELLSNSLMYAFTGKARGKIHVSLTSTADNKSFRLSVSDNGVGVKKENEYSSGGMGLRLARLLAENDLEGMFDIKNSEGAKILITFPQV